MTSAPREKSAVERTENLSLTDIALASDSVHFYSDGTNIRAVPKQQTSEISEATKEKATKTKSTLRALFTHINKKVSSECASLQTYEILKAKTKTMFEHAQKKGQNRSLGQKIGLNVFVKGSLKTLQKQIEKKEKSLQPISKFIEGKNENDPMVRALRETPFHLDRKTIKYDLEIERPDEEKVPILLAENCIATVDELTKAKTIEKKKELARTLEDQAKFSEQFIGKSQGGQIDRINDAIEDLKNKQNKNPQDYEKLYFLFKLKGNTSEMVKVFEQVADKLDKQAKDLTVRKVPFAPIHALIKEDLEEVFKKIG